jgi:hypothetical protein
MTNPIDEERPDGTAETALGADDHSTDSGGDVEVGPSGASEFSAAKASGGDVEVTPSSASSIDSGGDVEVSPDEPA